MMPIITNADRDKQRAKLKAEIQARMDFAQLPAWKRAKLRAQGKTPPGW